MRVWICHCQQRNPLNTAKCLRLGCNGVKPHLPAQPASTDRHYAYHRCSTCARVYQLLDFYGNPHRWLCANPLLGAVKPVQPTTTLGRAILAAGPL